MQQQQLQPPRFIGNDCYLWVIVANCRIVQWSSGNLHVRLFGVVPRDRIYYVPISNIPKIVQKLFYYSPKNGKVLSLLEACFGLISGSSLHMKIQIMDGNITENLGFKSLLWKVKKMLFFFLFIFKFFTQKWISFILTT